MRREEGKYGDALFHYSVLDAESITVMDYPVAVVTHYVPHNEFHHIYLNTDEGGHPTNDVELALLVYAVGRGDANVTGNRCGHVIKDGSDKKGHCHRRGDGDGNAYGLDNGRRGNSSVHRIGKGRGHIFLEQHPNDEGYLQFLKSGLADGSVYCGTPSWITCAVTGRWVTPEPWQQRVFPYPFPGIWWAKELRQKCEQFLP